MFRKGGQSTAIVTGNRRKVHTTFDDGSEVIEEFDVRSGELVERKRRSKNTTGREGQWEYLYGEPTAASTGDSINLRESSANPQFARVDSVSAFQWRVRNLPYPAEVYSVSVEDADRKLVIRTSNKKYYKRFNIPELDVLQLPLEQSSVTWSYANNTLLVSYKKPDIVLAEEKADREEACRMRAKDGDVDCKQQ